MASCEEAQQTPLQQTFSCDQQRRGKRVLLGALLGVLLVTVIVAACVAATVSPSGGPASWSSSTAKTRDATVQHTRPSQNGQERRDVRQQVRNRRVAPSPAPPRLPLPALVPSAAPTSDGSCVSRETETNIPAAHIKGHGIQRGKWIESTEESGSVVPGYQQRWQCNDVYMANRHHVQEQAFVDGGVWFNQTDKSIYVPKCGYYLIYSQVLFVVDAEAMPEAITVFHNLKIKHNCTWESDSGPIQLQAKASVAAFDQNDPDGGVTTTYTSDVVHMCGGGNVWIEIPDGANGVPCCPKGDETNTFLGLVLIADTPCSSWPPEITMTHEF